MQIIYDASTRAQSATSANFINNCAQLIRMAKSYQSNIWKMYLFKFLVSFHFIGGVLVPFFLDWGKISFTQIMILQSWFMFCIFIMEIPTGTIADYFGRKHSLLLACIVNIIAVTVYTITPNFYLFMLGEFLWATSVALLSGADDAFVYDSLKKCGKAKDSKKILSRVESFYLAGIMLGAPIGSLIAYKFGLRAPMFMFAMPLFCAFIVGLTFKEPVSKVKIESKRYLNILKEGVKFFYKHKILKILALDMIFIASIGYFMIWLYQPMLKQAGLGIAYYGIVHFALVAGQILILNRYDFMERIIGSKKRLLFLSALITGIMFVVGGLSSYLPLVLLAIVLGGGFGLTRRPLFVSYMNKYIPSSKRATVLSAVSMLRTFLLVVINPFVGLLTSWSLNYTLILLGVSAIIFSFISRVEERHLRD